MELNGQYSTFVGAFAKIYILSDSSGNVFYVGCTTQRIEQRVKQHIAEAKYCYPNTNKKKGKIIRDCGYNVIATIVHLFWVTANKTKNLRYCTKHIEKDWIEKYRLLGYELTNRSISDKKSKARPQPKEFIGQSFQFSNKTVLEVKQDAEQSLSKILGGTTETVSK